MSIWADANGWPVSPTILFVCVVAEILYFRGWSTLASKVQAKGDIALLPATVGTDSRVYQWKDLLWRGVVFQLALLLLLVAASTPVDVFSGRFFWVHMVQHLLLLVIIAPLVVAAAPLYPLWLGLPARARSFLTACAKLPVSRTVYNLGHWLRQPAVCCVLLIAGTWVWHWPALYDLALTNDLIHDWFEHSTFLAVSFLFWSQVIYSPPLSMRTGYIGRMGCVGIAIVQNLVLAVLLAFATSPLYAPYAQLGAVPGGLSVMQDQQLGAGIMWTFGDVPFGIAFSVLVQRWLASQPDNAGATPQLDGNR